MVSSRFMSFRMDRGQSVRTCPLTIEDRGVRRKGVTKPNLVAAAVRLAGGPSSVAAICGVARQTIYDWISECRVERLIDALRLSRASGVPIENLAGDDVEKLAAPVQLPRPERRRRKTLSDSSYLAIGGDHLQDNPARRLHQKKNPT